MQDRVRFEMANIKQTRLKMEATITVIEIEEKQNELPEDVKEQIWEAVLYHQRCGRTNPLDLAKELKEAFILINS